MLKRMLIDASHPEETRVVVIDGQRVDEFDFEAASKRPLKGNIYLAKVTRVEPSLQAAFVEYGGNRQGFLAFSEIHPDYYQIPVADRQALIAEQQEEALRRADDEFESVATGVVSADEDESEGEEHSNNASGDAPEPTPRSWNSGSAEAEGRSRRGGAAKPKTTNHAKTLRPTRHSGTNLPSRFSQRKKLKRTLSISKRLRRLRRSMPSPPSIMLLKIRSCRPVNWRTSPTGNRRLGTSSRRRKARPPDRT